MKLRGVNEVAVNVGTVITRLNQEFESQKVIFWYDDNAEFNESIPEIESNIDATVWQLHKSEQFKTKLFLEEHRDTKYLIYAPFAKPAIEQNLLTDIEKYSGSFTADIYQLTLHDAGLPIEQLQFVKEHFKFFKSQERIKAFQKYRDARVNQTPEFGVIATILKLNRLQLNEILFKLFNGGLDGNKYLSEFQKYGVSEFFWKLMNREFGYVTEENSLVHLLTALFLNYTYAEMEVDFPKELENFKMEQISNVVAFMSDFSDSYGAHEDFEKYAAEIWDKANLQKHLRKVSQEALQKINFFAGVDQMILTTIIERIQANDLNARLGGKELGEICAQRGEKSKHRNAEYQLLEIGLKVLQANFVPYDSMENAIARYITSEYQVDTLYRQFVSLYVKVGDTDTYQAVKVLVERQYINQHLNPSIQSWNDCFDYDLIPRSKRQLNFYRHQVAPETNRVVVIISDALRFELAKDLQDRLEQNDRISTSMDYLLTNLPSVTYMGMPSLLPHRQVELMEDKKILLVNGQPADNREKREKILQEHNEDSVAYQLDDLKKLSSTQLKQKFANQKVVYVYHNQVDAVGDNAKNEDEVFKASAEAISEIDKLIESLRTINVAHVIVTADHGYIYREEKLSETDKIDLESTQPVMKSLRYAITAEKIDEIGVGCVPLSTVLGNDDPRYVYYPKSANVFKASGSNNYVHGGSSLQEMVVPVLDVKTSSNKSQAEYVELKLGNSSKRVTGLTVPIPLIQTAPISDKVLPADYRIYFIDDQGNLISNQKTVKVNSTANDVGKQQQQIQLTLRSQTYDRSKAYQLVIENTDSGEKTFEKFAFDITISNDFGFDF
ncbi:DNA repair protein [Ligilactobacillus pabuli]|uniref:DNA repair protein n=1 Tax=Ligilactobacillus pabuli TaxID=2886039 RepID=A0ABQ5JJU4_9LACO|nr:DNA repair protein [Ligilactobacillus pabuli]